MSQLASNISPALPTLPSVDAKQDLALTAILAGATDGDAAKKAGVRRETVHRWRHADPHFIAELARRRQELWGAQVDQLRGLFTKAIGALSDALDAQSPPGVRLKAAGVVLRAVGMEQQTLRPAISAVSPDAVIDEWVENERQRKRNEELTALLASCGV